MDDDPKKQWRQFEKLRSSKNVKRRLRKMESASVKHAHKFIVKRWENIREVRRHALAWLFLLGILIGSLALQTSLMRSAYQEPVASERGTYSEGVLGRLDTLNPIYATTQPERSAAKLLFAGLLAYDTSGSLKTDLAKSWRVEEQGKRYVVTLKKDIIWSDNEPITAKDVAFTINSIKDADARSPHYSSWRDIMVSAPDDRTVVFDLPVAYAPFPHFLTIGILPAHKFKNVPAADLRAAAFNRQPITSGPFDFRSLQTIDIDKGRLVVHMVANEQYHGSTPKLQRFQLYVYGDRDELRKAFMSAEVSAVADFTADDLAQIGELSQYNVRDIPVNNVALALFKTDSEILGDSKVRSALRLATDRDSLIRTALNGRARAAETPIPSSMLSGSEELKQPAYDPKEAERLLTEAGWVVGEDGKRSKDGQPLRLSVVTIKTGDYPNVLESLSSQWAKVGVRVDPVLADPADIQQNILAPRGYDVLLYELAIGGDPDVYAYWHSSQVNMRGLNLANYKSSKADDALASARSRFEKDLRGAKYKTFVQQWLNDVPGVVLYQPTMHYISRDPISIEGKSPLVDSVDRFRNVQYWSLSQEMKNQTP